MCIRDSPGTEAEPAPGFPDPVPFLGRERVFLFSAAPEWAVCRISGCGPGGWDLSGLRRKDHADGLRQQPGKGTGKGLPGAIFKKPGRGPAGYSICLLYTSLSKISSMFRRLAMGRSRFKIIPKELYQEFMGDISDEIDRESKIIDDLLTLVRMDKSSAEINITPVSYTHLDVYKRQPVYRPAHKETQINIPDFLKNRR